MTKPLLTRRDIGLLTFVSPHDPVLNQTALEVSSEELHAEIIQAVIDRMLEVASGETFEASGVKCAGLAAPQIGVSKRLIVVDTVYTGNDAQKEGAGLQAFVNPRIVERSEETEIRREGCYSTGKVRGLVERAARITVEALDRKGHPIRAAFEGFTARVLQHEIDHLDGVRFPDRITNDTHLHWVDTKEDIAAHRQSAERWTCLCPRERWEAIKAGKDRGSQSER